MVNIDKTRQKRFWDSWRKSGAIGTLLPSGRMPNTGFTYEEFEGLLGSYYLTYVHFQESSKQKLRQAFENLNNVLTKLAEIYGVQKPVLAVKNVRSKKDWGVPKKFSSYFSVKDCLNSFYYDFGVIQTSDEAEQEVYKLAELVTSPEFVF
jgi:hypothetical protein